MPESRRMDPFLPSAPVADFCEDPGPFRVSYS